MESMQTTEQKPRYVLDRFESYDITPLEDSSSDPLGLRCCAGDRRAQEC